jgi:protein involved in polysaccharide export with SLBB domain
MFFTNTYRGSIASILLLVPLWTGCCGSLWHTMPANRVVGPRLFDAPRANQEPINFICLRQDPPPVYQLGPRDILGIYIEGVLGRPDDPPPVHFPEQANVPPAIGYPIPVREDGTLPLPLIPPINVTGLTLAQAEMRIRQAYTLDRNILRPGRDRIIVTLIRPRTYEVIVVREDTGGPGVFRGLAKGELILGSGKRGVTYRVELPAYENDVLHALNASGGLPGVDAKNRVTILRGNFLDVRQQEQFLRSIDDPAVRQDVLASNPNVIKIPLRTAPNEPLPPLTQEDIILASGDIVFIESREAEVFYTGGLLQGGQHPLPRDYDLDVLGAIAMAGGSVASAMGGTGSNSSFGGSGGSAGIIPPTRVIVVRIVNGEQVAIRIDLKRALRDPQERILIQPNDFLMLEYTCCELLANITLGNLQFNYLLNGWK